MNMKKLKCLSCGQLKERIGFIYGVCPHCQDYIIARRKEKDGEWYTEDMKKHQLLRDALEDKLKELKNAKLGLELISLLNKVRGLK